MGWFIVGRALHALPVLLMVSVIVFLAIRLVPGDPVDALFPPDAAVTQDAKAALRRQLGLNRPLPVQYAYWLARVVRGDLGVSIASRQPVGTLLGQRWPRTAELAAASLAIGIAAAVPMGVVAAVWRGHVWDVAATGGAMVGISIPAFALGTLLILVFSIRLHWLPSLGDLVLPALTQGIGIAAILVRTVRADVVRQLGAEYVRTASAKGMGRRRILLGHVLPNALVGTLTLAGWVLGYQLGGAVVVEQVFTWPGIGLLTVQAIFDRDYPVVQGAALVIACSYILVNLVVDVGYAWLDPRIRYA